MSSTSISGLLEKLGFRAGSTVETIVTTLNADGSVNPAPMGITRKDGISLEIKPFKTSQTHRNLQENPNACINITSDPDFYLQTAFKDVQFIGLHRPRFNGLRLEQADAYILVKKTNQIKIDETRTAFHFKVGGIEYKIVNPRAFNRGDSAAIDAVIHATRMEVFLNYDKLDEARDAKRRFITCRDVVNRVTKSRVIDELEQLVDGWSVNQ